MSKLRMCPFCKNETGFCITQGLNGDRVVQCAKCGATGPEADSDQEAIELWNNGV